MRAIQYIIDAVTSLYLLVLLARLVLPFVRANFRNPLAQGIFRLTSPLVVPLRRLLPPIGRVDTATLLVAFVIQYAAVLLIVVLRGMPVHMPYVLLTAFLKLAVLLVHLFAYATIVRIVLSWVAAQQYNPVTELLTALTEPLLAPVRRLLPSVGGFDLSPIFVIIGLFALGILIGDFRPYPV